MQNNEQLCQVQGHKGCQLTHICIFMDCKEISRYVCDSSMTQNKAGHDHDDKIKCTIKLENFMQYFTDQRLPQIEVRLKSQYGNEAKMKYLTKLYEEYFDDQLEQYYVQFYYHMDKLNCSLKKLINLYKKEIVTIQLLNDTYQQLILNGLQCLNLENINILINNKRWELIETEINYFNDIQQILYNFKKDLKKQRFNLQHKKFTNILKKIRTLYDYLDFQQHSNIRNKFFLNQEKPMNISFFSKNDIYIAMINQNHKHSNINQLRIRKQNTLNVIDLINFNRKIWRIKFDPLFKYCIIQEKSKHFYIYAVGRSKQFKLIQKYPLEQIVIDYFLSYQNIIIIYQDFIAIKPINFNGCINEINEIFVRNCCYGSNRNLIATNGIIEIKGSSLKIFEETQKQNQPLINSDVDELILDMKFINNDSHLLTQDKYKMILWKIDFNNLMITKINQISLQQINRYHQQYFINQTEFNIIKSTYIQDYEQLQIEIFDLGLNLCYRFQVYCQYGQCKFMYLTKNYLVIFHKYKGSQLIKRRQLTDFERLENDY